MEINRQVQEENPRSEQALELHPNYELIRAAAKVVNLYSVVALKNKVHPIAEESIKPEALQQAEVRLTGAVSHLHQVLQAEKALPGSINLYEAALYVVDNFDEVLILTENTDLALRKAIDTLRDEINNLGQITRFEKSDDVLWTARTNRAREGMHQFGVPFLKLPAPDHPTIIQ